MSITEDEAALYDRQIRLWGLEAQKRLRNATVLVAGVNGLGAEISKNLILAGVKSLTLLDHANVSKEDYGQFLIDYEKDQGKNRADCSLASAQCLNPMVEVIADSSDLSLKDDAFFKGFTCVCLTGSYSTTLLSHINTVCHEAKVLFYSGHTWGFFGYGFVDLGGHHTFIEENQLPPAKNKASGVKEDTVKETVKKTLDYVSLSKTLAVKAGKANFGIDKKTSPLFFLLHVLLHFVTDQKRDPMSLSQEGDQKLLKQIRDRVQTDLGLSESALPDSHFEGSVFGELSPVCAIVGGVLAQDVIKAISGNDAPIHNVFLFDGVTCKGLVEHIGR